MKSVLFFLLSLPLYTLSQTAELDTVFCDCAKAKVIQIAGKWTTSKTIAPPGKGEVMEIAGKGKDARYAFEKEHHTAWYKLVIKTTGLLTMDVIPSRAEDDYDFMLYKAYGATFCDSLLTAKMKPVRSCISRDKAELSGRTGLSVSANNEFVQSGVAAAYSKALPVKSGEIYYLVLDNVYEKGEGHQIRFFISTKTHIAGTVVDENKNPVEAEITVTDLNGEVIAEQKSKADGSYTIDPYLVKGADYSINFYQDNSLTYTQTFKVADTMKLKSLKTVLPKLRKGLKYSVGTINFVGNSVKTLPQALPAMKNLAKLMKKNPALKIMIIGHMNGPDPTKTKEWGIEFTRGRATTVKDFLIGEGIDASRIETDGKGDSEMLFPGAMNEEKAVQNRRVEIMVLEY
jgi:outer membrane protein OmpA-like peptidoglycan-associated protein